MSADISFFALFLFLLFAPDVHNRLVGQKLNAKHQRADGESANGNILALLHIAESTGDDLLGGVISVVIADGIVVHGGIKELGENPTGADRHHTDIASRTLKLAVCGAREGEYKRLRRAVHIDKGYGLK